jgi:hypothetical protein
MIMEAPVVELSGSSYSRNRGAHASA